MKSILVTGSAGFIAGYLVDELLKQDWRVIGIDNYSKYGKTEKSYDNHPNYVFVCLRLRHGVPTGMCTGVSAWTHSCTNQRVRCGGGQGAEGANRPPWRRRHRLRWRRRIQPEE